MAEPSTRAKWRALRSARSSTLKKCLTGIHIVREAILQQPLPSPHIRYNSPSSYQVSCSHPGRTSEVPMRLKKSNAVPRTDRPRIPDYGISKSKAGLLRWKWAVRTLSESREYWLVTVRAHGRPHAMILWGLWIDGAFLFGPGSKTQKARNFAKNPNRGVGTPNAAEAGIFRGVA